ncbi:HAAS signaling domain-containing protein [Kitasatospora sp. NPDC087861]|uniref:HAAS signaling domain-containing protein n=1 Tax=Kitasatospora sp. NPDC087861 TaxID=3364070 RepID=UPI0037F3F59D
MNEPTAHPLVRAHLDAVARYTAPLPEERRRELLADLREHVEISLASCDPADEATVRQVLEQLGSPRRIADAALDEEGVRARPEPESGGRTTLTLVFAVLAMPLLLIPAVGPALALAAAVIAATRVARSAQWTRREKKRATLLLLSPVLVTPLACLVLAMSPTGLTPLAILVACAVGFCPTLLAAFLLSRSAARLRSAALAA